MIFYPCTGLYDARSPQLEEEEVEIFYRHPVHPLKVNQLGIIYFDDDVVYSEHSSSGGYAYWVNSEKKYYYTGTKAKCIWECYNNEIQDAKRFGFLDANPFNLTPENIFLKDFKIKNKEIISKEDEFIKNTMKWMTKCEDWCQRKSIDPEVFWAAMGFSLHMRTQIGLWKTRWKKMQSRKRK